MFFHFISWYMFRSMTLKNASVSGLGASRSNSVANSSGVVLVLVDKILINRASSITALSRSANINRRACACNKWITWKTHFWGYESVLKLTNSSTNTVSSRWEKVVSRKILLTSLASFSGNSSSIWWIVSLSFSGDWPRVSCRKRELH